ncbi:flavin reductase family protein [Streptomyces sp. NPDC051133]|uniref:flavin reductase family protein n=1 Tax=Streptomyces sp. NPDC051133 TaxID=3155521 RepID=UPI003432AD39
MTTLTPRIPSSSAALDDAGLREVMSSFCTGVAVVTAAQPDGRPAGMAVQSFSSVSLDPPLVCFCPARTSSTWPKIRAAGRFAVNVLSAGQQRLCRQFAVTGGDKFTGVDWRPGLNGAPLLDGALATVECELADTFPGGDHVIALGRVTALATADRTGDTGPLLYFRRTYGRLRSSSSRSASIASARSRSEA